MATLLEIGTSGFAGVAPTPVASYAINQYLVNDELLSLMDFQNIALGSNIGNLQATHVYYEGDGAEAAFRSIGAEYSADNETPLSKTYVLKMLGGAFNVDRVLERAFSSNPAALSNWREQQLQQKLNKIKNGFAKYFIAGNSAQDAKQFDGLDVYFTKWVAQVEEALPVDGLTPANALTVERYLNKAINKIKPKNPNLILTTADGKTFLQTLNAYRNKSTETIEVNNIKRHQYMGIPIVSLPETYFSEADRANGIPVIFVLIDGVDGIHCAVAQDGKVLDVVNPEMGNGTLVKEGACEMVTVPIMDVYPFAASKCFINEAAAAEDDAAEATE